MKFRDLKGVKVVSISDAQELGVIDDLLLHLQERRAVGFEIKSGGLFASHKTSILLEDVKSIGPDAVTIDSDTKLVDQADSEVLKTADRMKAISGLQVLDDRGRELGHAADLDVDFNTGEFLGLILSGTLVERVQQQDRVVPASRIKSIGDKVIVITSEDENAVGSALEQTSNPQELSS